MQPIERRKFLTGGSVVVAAAGLAATMPGLAGDLAAAAEEARTAGGGAHAVGGAPTSDAPLVAHVRDLGTGEIVLFSGTEEYTLHDPALAARLVQAAR